MEADSFRIAKVFSNGGDIHFRLPYFQREYAWNIENWRILWDDISDLYEIFNPEKPPEHFMGSLVVINEGTLHGTIPVFKLVDGQQRLTTISLILCALADIVKISNPDLYNRIRKYITNPDERNDLYFKLLPTTKYGDRDSYLSIIVGNKPAPINGSQIHPAYLFYRDAISKKMESAEMKAETLFLVIVNSLQVVFINLNHDERPYQIFESLNAKGKPLTQADLVRNYIAMKLPEARQPEIFENHWSVIEELLQEKRQVGRSRLGELTAFIRHYLAYRNGILGNEEHVYARFRDRIESEFNTPTLFENEVKTLKQFSIYYDRFLRPQNEPDKRIRSLFERLNTFEISTGYPFLLAMYNAYFQKQLTCDQFVEGLQLLENYIVRRYLTGEPTNYLNKVFPALWKDIDIHDFIPSLKNALLTHNYPGDYRIRQTVLARRMYDNSASTRAKTILILETINLFISDRKKTGARTILSGPATIEHIMPQKLSDRWKEDLGEGFELIYDQYINTLGNLTLVTSDWNSSLSNSPFKDKKERLQEHGLLLNSDYFKLKIEPWNEVAIKNRAEYLLQFILELWPAIGELPAPKSVYTKPIQLTILGQKFRVESWRDVAMRTTEEILQLVSNIDDLSKGLQSYLAVEPFPKASRRLSNGWYLNVNLSADSLKSYCKKLVEKAGLDINDWQVEEVPY